MDKIDSLNQTADFHRLFNHPILDKPTIPDKKRCALRVELISEELRELKDAIEDNDIVEIADASVTYSTCYLGPFMSLG